MPLNEFDLIEKYFKDLTSYSNGVIIGPGDDAAIISVHPGQELAISCDTLVSGVHFDADTEPYNLGYKCLAVNLSDLAAMGAHPAWATLSLIMPYYDHEWLTQFSTGFADLANQYQVGLIGGDTTRGPLSITIQIHGTVPAGTALTRKGAKAGDLICISGQLGCATLALRMMSEKQDKIPAECLGKLHRPAPRIELGFRIRDLATAAIDISDGLASDLEHVVTASGVGAEVYLNKLPLCKELVQNYEYEQQLDMALSGGDDYELCFTIPGTLLDNDKIIQDCVTVVGRTIPNTGKIKWLKPDGTEYKLTSKGYSHF